MSLPVSMPPAGPPPERPGAGPAAPAALALSPSRAADFKQCPLKYRFRAVDRLPETPSRQAVRGTVVHAVLERLFELPAAERIPEAAEALLPAAWERVRAERPEAGELIPEAEFPAFAAEVAALLASYYRLEDPTAFDPEACELRLETASADGVPLRGFVDRLDAGPGGALRVVDYKTGKAPGVTRETSALFQLKFYALMMFRSRGVVPAELRLIYLADEQVLTYTPDAAELERFERTLGALWRAVAEAVRTGDFRPSTGWLCAYCDFKPLCPAYGGTPPPYPGPPAAPDLEITDRRD
ncbi:RecB family exonuclease [Nocardia harenae]|uniref:RecB family exonuclease n=1 Tax=Nocardia harenae TaxID=358707 RepID=UPI000831BFC2|nr:PD-(D/E)XK nuclease family protein [Nocardia harenae]